MAHPLGTDNLGRDVLSRLLHGSRLSLGMAVTATIGSSVIGLFLGVLAGVRGGRVDALIMRTGAGRRPLTVPQPDARPWLEPFNASLEAPWPGRVSFVEPAGGPRPGAPSF